MGRGFLLSTRRSYVSSQSSRQSFGIHIQDKFQCFRPQVRARKFFLVDTCKIRSSLYFPCISLFSFSLAICTSSHNKTNSFSSSTWGLNIKTGGTENGGVNVRGPCSSRPRFRSVLAPSRRLMTWGLATTVVAGGSCRSSEVVVREGIAMESAGFWLAARRSA